MLHKFYCSKAWRELSYALKIKANGKCQRCGEIVLDSKYLIAHHKTELTEDNINNVSIALNPDEIEIICHHCHNKEHKRFGNEKKVYIIYGSPLSGKNTMVGDLYRYGDIVLDIDAIWKAITLEEKYIKPNNVRFNVFKLRDELLDQIKTRYGNWYNAYVIMSLADKYERERVAKQLGAETIYCEATKEECLERAVKEGRPNKWIDYIEDWFEKYNG